MSFITVDIKLLPDWVTHITQQTPQGFDRRSLAKTWHRANIFVGDTAELPQNIDRYGRVIAHYIRQLVKRNDWMYDTGVMRPTGYSSDYGIRVRMLDGFVDYVWDDSAHSFVVPQHVTTIVAVEGTLQAHFNPKDITHRVLPKLVLPKDMFEILDALSGMEPSLRQRTVVSPMIKPVALKLLQAEAIEFRGRQVKLTDGGMAMLVLSRLAARLNREYP